jgi:hypothetical protein
MSIMAAQGSNDARASARLLAGVAKECIEDPTTAPSRAVVLNNVYRLLETYRVNPFLGIDRTAAYPQTQESEALNPLAEQHVQDVRDVLRRAVEMAFEGQSIDDAILIVEDVLRGMAYPDKFDAPKDSEKVKAMKFFSEVLKGLQFA